MVSLKHCPRLPCVCLATCISCLQFLQAHNHVQKLASHQAIEMTSDVQLSPTLPDLLLFKTTVLGFNTFLSQCCVTKFCCLPISSLHGCISFHLQVPSLSLREMCPSKAKISHYSKIGRGWEVCRINTWNISGLNQFGYGLYDTIHYRSYYFKSQNSRNACQRLTY